MGLLSTIVGGIFGATSANKQNQANLQAQREANQTNLQIAQMNNDFNREMLDNQIAYNREEWQKSADFNESMMDKSNQFQVDMWERNNAYNDPSAQRERLEQAGLNPYMFLDGGSAGSATFSGGSSASAPSPMGVSTPTASPVSVSPVMSDTSGVRQTIQDTIENVLAYRDLENRTQLSAAQAEQLQIENKYKAAELISDIYNKMEDTRSKSLHNFYQDIINRYAEDTQMTDLANKRQSLANLGMQYQLMETQKALNDVTLQYLPEQLKAGIAESYSRISLNYAQGQLTYKQLEHECEKIIETQARAFGIKIDNATKSKMQSSLVEQAKYSAEHAKNTRYPTVMQNFGETSGDDIKEWWKNLWN